MLPADRPARLKVPRAARIENGTPLCQWTMLESCQPPASALSDAAAIEEAAAFTEGQLPDRVGVDHVGDVELRARPLDARAGRCR